MEFNIFLNAGIVSVVYIIVKFLEMRFIDKENKPLKILFRDGLIVYLSSIAGYYLFLQINPLTENIPNKIQAFTNNPDF